jgi:hypothetical protein
MMLFLHVCMCMYAWHVRFVARSGHHVPALHEVLWVGK